MKKLIIILGLLLLVGCTKTEIEPKQDWVCTPSYEPSGYNVPIIPVIYLNTTFTEIKEIENSHWSPYPYGKIYLTQTWKCEVKTNK